MAQFAELVLAARTDGLRRAREDLNDLRNTGARTEQGITGSMGKVSKGFSNAAIAASKFAAGAAAAVAASVGIGQAVGVIRQFEGSMSQVAAITGATGAELAALRDIAKELGSTTEFSAAQAADGLRFLGMAGFSAAESMKAIPAVLDLATASSMGLAESADIASNVLSGFGLAADDAAQVADVLAAASSRANTSVSQLGNAMSTVAPISAALGIDLADTAAAIGVLSDAGIQGERAGTALRGVLASLAGPTAQAQEALAQYGITAAQVNPETQSLTEIFGLLRERGLSTADAMTIFGREAASGALVLAEASTRVGEFGEELRGAEGAASEMAGIMRDNLGGAANTLMSTVQGLAIALGEAGLTAVLIGALEAITAVVRGLTMLVEGVGAVIDFVQRHTTATEAVTEAMQQQAAQAGDTKAATDNVAEASRGAAEAALQEARAQMAVIDAYRESRAEKVRSSEDYQRLQNAINLAAAELDMLYQTQSRNGGKFAPMTAEAAAAMDELKTQLVLATRAQNELLESANFTSSEYNKLQGEVDRLEAELAQAAVAAGRVPDELIELNPIITSATGNVSALQGVLNGAAAAAQSLAGAMASAASQLGPLGSALSALGGGGILGRVTGGLGGVLGGIVNSDAVDAAGNRLAQLGNTMKILFERSKAAAVAQDQFASSVGSAGSSAGSAAKEVDKLADEISRLEDAADPTRKFRREMEQLDTLLENGLSDGAYALAVRELNEELVESTPILSDVNDAFGQMVDYMFDGFKDGMAGIWDIFKNTLKQMIATAAKSRITIGLGMAATGGAGAAAAALPGGGGILSNLLPGVFGGGGALSGIGSGLMGVFSGGGLGSSFANLGGLLSGSVSGWGAVGAALPAVGLLVGVPLALGALFKKTEVLVAEGVRARIDGASLELDSYEKTKTNNGFGMSSGFDREFERLDDAVQSAVGARLDATIDALGAFGLGTDLTGFQFSKRTEIKDGETFEGESEEVIREALNAAVEYLAEGALEVYQLAGEGLSDTLTRLSTAIQVVNPLVDRLGNHMLDMSLDGAAAASALIEAAGGLEAFAAETAFVFENFTLDAEKAHIAADELGIQMRALGVDTIPATHAAFMELVNAQDLATEGGREMYAALLDIAPLFVQVKGTAQEAADAALNQANANDDLTNSSNDAAAAARELAAQQREQESLLLQIARMTGNVAYIREQELAALNEANRPLQEYIYLLEDQAAALEATEAALRTALNTANDLVATMEGNLADANRDLEAAYADLDRVVNDRLQTLRDERQGYLDTAEAARQALITLGAITEAKTPLQEAEDAARAYEDALSQLGAAISRERSTLEANIADWNAELEEISNRVYEESQALLDAQAGYDTALNNLSAGISRERSALESEADRLRAALFPNEGQDLVAALETRDVMGETLGIAERLANAAREVFRLNEDVVAQQRTAALAQLRAMLASGQVDGANLDRVISDATSFDSRQFATFEEMSFAQKETGNILMDLSALQESIATQAQNKEDLRAEEARQVALDQLSALEDQIAGLDALADRFGLLQEELSSGQLATLADQQLAALDKARAEDAAAWAAQQAADDIRRGQLNDQIREAEKRLDELRDIEVAVGLVTTELATGAIFTEVGLLKGEAEAAKLAAIEYYTEEQQRAQDAADAAQDQIDALQSQYDALRDVEAAVNTVEGAIAQLASAQAAQAKALQDLADAQAAADAAQDAVDQATGGGSGGDVTSGMSSAEKRLYGILDALDGAQGAALLGADAFGQFSEDNMNAMLTNAAIAALTGSAADVAGAYADELGRNADVAGLVAYVGALESGFFDLAGVAADLAKSTEAITGIIPGFAIPGVDTGGGSSSGGSSSGGGGSSSGGGASSGDGGMPEGWERPNGYVAALFGTYGVPWSESQYQNWLDKYDDRDALYGGLIGFTDAWKAAFEDDFGEVPSYRNGTDYHPGGWARLHENEMVNLPRGTSVSTAGEVREMVEELKASRKQNEANAAELRQMRRLLTELADIEGDRRAEELSA